MNRLPAYVPKIIPAMMTHDITAPGTLTVVDLFHDEWCQLFAGGPCTCNPDVRVVTREGGAGAAPAGGAGARAHTPRQAVNLRR